MIDKIYSNAINQICYFRTSVKKPNSKVLIQITNRCNMNCKHCFVKATSNGFDINVENFNKYIVEQLRIWKTKRVTLTGGEPLLHKDIFHFAKILNDNDISVAICTNGMLLGNDLINKFNELNDIHINVSLDGFSETSYSNFRGVNNKFFSVKQTIEHIGKIGLLKGILVTPNIYSSIDEYVDLCKFAKANNAKYVLFNPIAPLGRGVDNVNICGVSDSFLNNLYASTAKLKDSNFDINYIRFPIIKKSKIANCIYNRLYYIYANGNITKCPYVSFSQNMEEKANIDGLTNIIGNVFNGAIEKVEYDIEDYGECIAHIL
ncbi:MAG: radical SAM protein [Tepidibacter sp.]|jgi:MoaA/NifB/PqqE/SkfB family radical SAM enzyme|uniref:radical SAM protein n=1 Tax=Tepidibacter sp. TaxID=2529387 RepID=UPI0025F5243B|nr:radical SAM protein [Tepidibacter sp.]MCT4507272.1 radical SAM protein [Tepidibacter sp.]